MLNELRAQFFIQTNKQSFGCSINLKTPRYATAMKISTVNTKTNNPKGGKTPRRLKTTEHFINTSLGKLNRALHVDFYLKVLQTITAKSRKE